jgi:glycosyltransferase involved in cell wall biosynthesis
MSFEAAMLSASLAQCYATEQPMKCPIRCPYWSWELTMTNAAAAHHDISEASAARGAPMKILIYAGGFAPVGGIEGQCLAALEILSRGRPIVATPVGALPQILLVPEFGAIAPLHDAREFARVLSRLGLGVVEGRMTPEAIRARFARIFSRTDIIDRYRAVLSMA